MANVKVSELPTATDFNDSDYTIIVQNNTTKKIEKTNILKNTIYSNNETVVGKWIDGKPIYRKVIDIGDLTDLTRYSDDGIIINTGITNLEIVTSIKVMGSLAYAAVFKNITDFIYWSPSNSAYGLMEFLVNNDSPALFVCKSTRFVPGETGITSAYAIIEYTKTTD